MENNIANIEEAKHWYRKYWQAYQKIEATYSEWKKKRDEVSAAMAGLRQFLQYSGVNMEELEQSIKSTAGMEESLEGKRLPDLIYETLLVAGRPMHYTEILDVAIMRGYSVGGQDPRNTVLAYLSRHKKRFTKAPEAGKGFYKLKE